MIFTARSDGYHHCRIPTMVVSPGGQLLVFAECRKKAPGHPDYWDIDIRLRRSADAGRTWDEPRVILRHADFGDGPLHNFAPIRDLGRHCVHVLFCHAYREVYYICSDDDGATWTHPREITASLKPLRNVYPWKVVATGPGHGICKIREPARGRLIVPVWMCKGVDGQKDPHRPSDLTLLYSDDGGEHWQAGPMVMRHEQASLEGPEVRTPSEVGAAELDDGSVLFNARNESGPYCRVVSRSADGVDDWSAPSFQKELLDPVCHGSLLEVPGGPGEKSLLVFVNPHTLDETLKGRWGRARDRKNLCARISRDQGRTWEPPLVIEPGPSGYSDLAFLQGPDGARFVFCAFECGMIDNMYDSAGIALWRLELPV